MLWEEPKVPYAHSVAQPKLSLHVGERAGSAVLNTKPQAASQAEERSHKDCAGVPIGKESGAYLSGSRGGVLHLEAQPGEAPGKRISTPADTSAERPAPVPICCMALYNKGRREE